MRHLSRLKKCFSILSARVIAGVPFPLCALPAPAIFLNWPTRFGNDSSVKKDSKVRSSSYITWSMWADVPAFSRKFDCSD